MTTINSNIPQVVTVQPKKEEISDKSSASKENKGMSKTTKALIAAGALTAVTITGILIRNKAVSNKIAKEIASIDESLKKAMSKNENLDLFDNTILQDHIDVAKKLPKKEQLAKLKEISAIATEKRSDAFRKNYKLSLRSSGWPNPVEQLPEELKDVLATKDQLKFNKAYVEYCDNLFQKSKTAGATIQESVENVFGKNSLIKPHTYDKSKEANVIALGVNTPGAGFQDVTVRSDNYVTELINHKNQFDFVRNMGDPSPENKFFVNQHVVDGKPVVDMVYHGNYNGGRQGFRLFSPNKDLTPAQTDMLKLKDVENLPIEDLYGMTSSLSAGNYDAILSFIQTHASNIK